MKHKYLFLPLFLTLTNCVTIDEVIKGEKSIREVVVEKVEIGKDAVSNVDVAKIKEKARLSLEAQGLIGGGAAGGGAGYVYCRLRGNDTNGCRTEIVVGAAVGAVAGGLYGRSIEERRQQYASEEALYDAQLDELREVNAVLQSDIVTLDNRISEANAEIERITNKLSTEEEKQQEFEAIKQKTLAEIQALDQQIISYVDEVETSRQLLEDSTADDNTVSVELAAEIATLEEQIAALDDRSVELASISTFSF